MASMPVAAATLGGSVRVLSGSRMARRGNSGKSAISSFTLRSGSLITAAIETSLPVPAVSGLPLGLGVFDPRGLGALAAGAGGGGEAGERRYVEGPAHAVALARHKEEPPLLGRAPAVGEDRVGALGRVHHRAAANRQ